MKQLTLKQKGFLFLSIGLTLIVLVLPFSLYLNDIGDALEAHTFLRHLTAVGSSVLMICSILLGIIGIVISMFALFFKIDLFD